MNDRPVLVLMVEDSADIHQAIREYISMWGDHILLLSALTLEEGCRLFREHREHLTLIILDACLTPRALRIDTLSLLEEITASGFQGPVISSSSDRDLRQQMRAHGCTDATDKADLLSILRHYL